MAGAHRGWLGSDSAELVQHPDEMTLGGWIEAGLGSNRSGGVEGSNLASCEQIVRRDAEPAAQLDEHLQRRVGLAALDAGYVLMRDAQLMGQLSLCKS